MRKSIAIILIFFMVISSGCIRKKEVTTKARNYIVYNIEKFPESLIMLDKHSSEQEDLLLGLFEGLVSVDKEGNIIPNLASEWKLSEDRLSYQFTLRESAKWSDGSQIIAKDFVNLFSEILKYKNNIYKQQLYCIFGARDYAENKVGLEGVAVNALNDKILEIRLNYPCSYFLEILSQPIYVLRKDFNYLEEWKDNYHRILYSGAFKLENISKNQEMIFTKNKMYWDSENVVSDKIYIKNESVKAFVLADYRWNEIDIITNPPESEINEFIKNDDILKYNSLQGMSLNFNLNKQGAVRDSNFRKAINCAISRNNIVNMASGQMAKNFLSPNVRNYSFSNALFQEDSSSVMAEEFLDKSQYKGEKLKLAYSNHTEKNKALVDEIVNGLNAVKISVIAEGYEEDRFREIIKNNEYDLLLTEYVGEYNSSMAFLEKWVSNSKHNVYGYDNIDYDILILKAKINGEVADMTEYLNSAEELLYKDMPFIPLFFREKIICGKKYIEGLEVNKRGNIMLKNIRIKKAI